MVTGTFHGSKIWALTEGIARSIFHRHYNGESITSVKCEGVWLQVQPHGTDMII